MFIYIYIYIYIKHTQEVEGYLAEKSAWQQMYLQSDYSADDSNLVSAWQPLYLQSDYSADDSNLVSNCCI
jgi:hypothetical protein